MAYLKEHQQQKITWVEMYNTFNSNIMSEDYKKEVKSFIKETSPLLYQMITKKPGKEVLDYYNDYNSVVVL